jgi:hypothetical protein
MFEYSVLKHMQSDACTTTRTRKSGQVVVKERSTLIKCSYVRVYT